MKFNIRQDTLKLLDTMNLEDRKKNFLKKAKEKWGDRFSYDLSNYDTDRSTISITDNETGEIFEFQPRNHLRTVTGKPTQTERGQKRSYNQNKFISTVKEKFGDQLDLSEAIYNGSGGLVIVTCRIHGNRYRTRASLLMHGHSGCPNCAIQNMKDSSYTRKVNWDDPEVIERLQELVNSRKTFTEIGEIFEVSGHQIGVIISKYNINVPDFRAEDNKKFVELVESGKYYLSELADIYNTSYECIWQRVKTLGLKNYKTREIFNPEQLDEKMIRHRLLNGESVLSIAESLGITRDKVQKSMDYYGIGYKDAREQIDLDLVNKIKAELLVDSTATYRSVGDSLGISESRVRDLSDRFDISFPIASRSNGEKFVEKYLKENNIDFIAQLKVNSPGIGRNSDIVRIDFVIPDKKIWIEYNGGQHYEFKKHFHGTVEEFEKQVRRDNNVRQYCLDNNIVLLEVPYVLDDFDSISEFLNKTIIEGIDPNSIIDYKSLYKYEM